MKTLLILRHAKSSWDNPDISDFERPLNERGLKAAPFMGEVISRKNLDPQVILSSPADRAKETAKLVKKAGQLGAEIEYVEGIYEASPLKLLQIVSQVDDENETVLLIGHNPGLEGFIRKLTEESYALPTAALAKIDLDIESWSKITGDCGKVNLFIRPKDEMNL